MGLKHPYTGGTRDEGNGKVKTFITDVRLNFYFGFIAFPKTSRSTTLHPTVRYNDKSPGLL